MEIKKFISDSSRDHKWLGFIPFSDPKKDLLRKFYMIITFSLFNLCTLILSLLEMKMAGVLHDVETFLQYCITMGSIVQCCLKCINNHYYINEFNDLNQVIGMIDWKLKSISDAKGFIDRYERNTSKIYRIAKFLYFLVCTLYCLQPILIAERVLMYNLYFPEAINWRENSFVFCAVSLYQILMTLYLINGNTLCEILCAAYINTFCGYQLVVLQEIDKINDTNNDTERMEKNFEQFNFIIELYEDVVG